MTFRISVLCFYAVFICVCTAETKIPIGMIYDLEDDLTLKSFQEAIASITGHDPTFQLISERVNGADQYQVFQAATRLLQKNVLSIVVPSTRGGFSSLISMSSNVQVPLISLSDKSVDDVGPFLITVGPNNIRAILDVMRFYRWHNVVYFYDKEDGPTRLQHLLRIGAGALKLNVLGMHKLERAELAAPLLRKAENDNPNTIINVALDMKPSLAAKVLNLHAKASSTSKKNIHFLTVEPVDDDFFTNNRDLRRLNVTVLSVYNPQSPVVSQKLANIDVRTASSKEDAKTKILLASDSVDLLDEAFTRFLQSRPETLNPLPVYYQNSKNTSWKFEYGTLVKQFISETYVNEGFTGPIQLDENGQRRGMTVYITESTPTAAVDAFTWTDQKGLLPIHPAYTMEKNALSEKKSLVVTVTAASPYVIINTDPKAIGNDRFQGYSKDLMDLIAGELGVEYEMRLSSDGRYGTRDSATGKWNGMIGELLNHQADMAVTDLTITATRQEVVDFSIPYMTVGITMLIKKPGGDGNEHGPSASSYFFLHIFTMDVWGCILVSFIGVGVLYFFVTKLTAVNIDPRTGLKKQVSVLDSLWFSFGSLLLHNTGIYPKSVSSRFLTAIWWLFVIFVATLYVSGLVSMLLVEMFGSGSWNNYKALSSKTTYSVIKEALRTGVPEIGCVQGGSTRAFFRDARDDVYRQLNEVLNENPGFLSKSNSEGVERVRKGGGKYAFLMESSSAHYVSFKHCDVAVMAQQLDSKGYGIAFSKGSPYRDVVNRVLLRLMEAGELQNLYLKWWIEGSPCFKKQERSYMDLYHTALTLSNVGGLFYCLITGVVLTLFISAIEYCIKRRRRGHHSVALTQISKGDPGDLNGDHEINHSVL